MNDPSHVNQSFESDEESSDDSEILGTLNNRATLALDKSTEDESWVWLSDTKMVFIWPTAKLVYFYAIKNRKFLIAEFLLGVRHNDYKV